MTSITKKGEWSLISADPNTGIEQNFINGDICLTTSGNNRITLTIHHTHIESLSFA
jgi:hypothetical protein